MSGKKRHLSGKTSHKSNRQQKKRNWYDLADTGYPESPVRYHPRSSGSHPRRFHPDLPPQIEPGGVNQSVRNAKIEAQSEDARRPRSRATIVQKTDLAGDGYIPYPISRSKRRKFPYFFLILGAAIAFIFYIAQIILNPTPPAISSGGGSAQPSRSTPMSITPPNIEGVSVQYDYYSIFGGSAEELRLQMSQRGPQDLVTGNRFDGYTRWNLNWNFETQALGGLCQIQGVTVDAKATVTMPKWDIPADVSSELEKKWIDYDKALREHELGHVKHAGQAKQEILQSFGLLPPAPSCSQTQSIADSLGGQIIQKYAQKDVEYDRITGHGATQGAVFP